MNRDYLHVTKIEIPCRVGTTADERAFPQILTLSFRVELPLSKPGETDDLKHTIDYTHLIQAIKTAIEKRTFNLVETVAETAASLILENPMARATEVAVDKKVFAGIDSVGVFIRREKKD
jgi:dihydroneopterin aldolase